MTHFSEKTPGVQFSGAANLTAKHEALRFLELLGKDPANTYFRTIPRGGGANKSRRGADLKGFDLQTLQSDNETSGVYAVIGNADGTSGGGGGVTKVDVRSSPAVFVEWDDRPAHEQEIAWEMLGLPRPTFQVDTGGKSIHSYWVLNEAATPSGWQEAQRRLIGHCQSDDSLTDYNRVMRVPGFTYLNRDGEATGVSRLINVAETRYSLEEVLANVPELADAEPIPQDHVISEWEPRCLEEIRTAAALIPTRVRGRGTYKRDRNALCGCSGALEEAGFLDPDQGALMLLAHHWPSENEARQVLDSATTLSLIHI